MERTLPRWRRGPRASSRGSATPASSTASSATPMRSARAWKEVIERRPTDKEALEGLTRLARARGDWALLDEVLERRQAHADGDDAVTVALERAQLADERLKKPERAVEILRHVLDELAPRNLEAHARLQKLLAGDGNLDGSLRVAERELFLTATGGTSCRLPSTSRGGVADERRAAGDRGAGSEWPSCRPDKVEALEALAGALSSDRRLGVALRSRREAARAVGGGGRRAPTRSSALRELAATAEKKLGDAKRGFEYLRLAHELGGSDEAAARRRAAPGRATRAVGGDVRRLRDLAGPRVAARGGGKIADEKLRDPKRAFAVVRSALELDPARRQAPARARAADGAPSDARGSARRLRGADRPRRRRRRSWRSCASGRRCARSGRRIAAGALDEMLRAFPYAPGDKELLAEVRRLAEATRRWDDALAVEGYRFHWAPEAEQLAIACEAAAIVEEKVKDPLRAFRAYLRAFQLAPATSHPRPPVAAGAHRRRHHRGAEAPAGPARAGGDLGASRPCRGVDRRRGGRVGALVIESSMKPAREPTLEVALDEVMFEDSRPHRLVSSASPPDETPRRRSDGRAVDQRPHDHRDAPSASAPPTMELSISDVAVVMKPDGKGEERRRGARSQGDAAAVAGGALPPAAVAAAARTIAGPHSAWDELALVQLNLPAEDEHEQFQHLLAVSEMWEKGAGNLDKAFEALAGAFKLDPDNQEARRALERLAESNGAWDQLVAVLDATIDETGNAERRRQPAHRLGARAREAGRHGQRRGALPPRARHAARRRGGDVAPRGGLPPVRALGRAGDAARAAAARADRAHARLRRAQGARARARRDLRAHGQHLRGDRRLDARGARVSRPRAGVRQPGAPLRVGRAVVQGDRVAHARARRARRRGQARGRQQARAIRQRIGAIFEKELELPERAIEAYSAVHDADAGDERGGGGARAALREARALAAISRRCWRGAGARRPRRQGRAASSGGRRS